MESYIEVTFFHNALVNIFCLFLAHAWSFHHLSKQQIYSCLGLVMLSSCFFQPYAWMVILIGEILQLCFLYRHEESVYVGMIGLRFILNLYFFNTVEGTIYNGQFFVGSHQFLGIEWSVLIILCISIIIKGKNEVLEHFFIRTCYVEQIKCKGYLDSGNLLFIENKPVIFLNQQLFEQLIVPKKTLCDFQTVSEKQFQWGKECLFSFNRKTWQSVICLPMPQMEYDCLINMKGLKG